MGYRPRGKASAGEIGRSGIGLSRRGFLKLLSAAGAGLVVGGCRTAVATEAPPLVAPTTASPPPPTPIPLAQVAIGRAATYQPNLVHEQVRSMLDDLGGLGDVVRPGDRVALKVNLTSGMHFSPPAGLSATESYVTHPEIVRALGEAMLDAGAGELFIVEAVYDAESCPTWGYEALARDLGATLVDLNTPAPYPDFASATVGEGWLQYESFVFNRILQEVDTFVSVAKMKCHWNAGITLSMKNLIGLVPVSEYRLDEGDWWRSALHGVGQESQWRLPRVILDLNRARPIHLAFIDGIKTSEGGEVPRGTFAPVAPGVLVAGKNALATDAVATAIMGFDPTTDPPNVPFMRSDNYLNMADELGLGTNRLEEIGVLGVSIDEVGYPFEPSWEQ
jgi:uncharacterized protein (DUF362 family)